MSGVVSGAPALKRATIPRPRLLDLFPAFGDARLVLVTGGAGTGKTTAVVEWVEHVSPEIGGTVWVPLHHGDRERIPFWSNVIRAVQDSGIAPSGGRLDLFSPDSLSPMRLTGVLHQLLSTIPSPFVIVLDDYHHALSPEIDADCRDLVAAVPQLTLVLISRARSDLETAVVAAALDVWMLDSDRFAFSPDETRALAARLGVDEELARRVHDEAGGWPLATTAMLLERPGPRTAADRSGFVADYVRSMLSSADEVERTLLLGTSMTDDFTAEAAAQISGLPLARIHELLRNLEWYGVTTKRRSGDVTRYRHHPAIQEELRRRAYASASADELVRISRIHAASLEHDHPDHALALLVRARDHHHADDLVSRDFSRFTTVYSASAMAAFRSIPPDIFRTLPSMVSARLLIESADPTIPAGLLRSWSRAVREVTARRWAAGEPRQTLEIALRIGTERMMGHGRLAGRFAAELRERIADPASLEVEHLRSRIPFMHALIALTELLNGDLPLALAHFEQTEQTGVEGGMPFDVLRGRNGQTLVTAVDGDIAEARRRLRAVQESHVPEEWGDHFGGINTRIARAMVALERLDTAAAHAEIAPLAGSEHLLETWPYLSTVTTHIALLRRGPRSAAGHLEAALERRATRPGPVPHSLASAKALLATMLARSAHPQQAKELLADAPLHHSDSQVAHAELALRDGELLSAITLASAIIDGTDAEYAPTKRALVTALLVRGAASWQHDQRDSARADVARAVGLLSAFELRLPLLAMPTSVRAELIDDEQLTCREALAELCSELPGSWSGPSPEALSRTERRVLALLMDGRTSEQSAQDLVVSVNTVKFHLKRIYRKLGVTSRKAAFARAYELGLIGPSA